MNLFSIFYIFRHNLIYIIFIVFGFSKVLALAGFNTSCFLIVTKAYNKIITINRKEKEYCYNRKILIIKSNFVYNKFNVMIILTIINNNVKILFVYLVIILVLVTNFGIKDNKKLAFDI